MCQVTRSELGGHSPEHPLRLIWTGRANFQRGGGWWVRTAYVTKQMGDTTHTHSMNRTEGRQLFLFKSTFLGETFLQPV